MKTLLIAHEEDSLNRVALAAWLASVSDLAGIISIVEPSERKTRRVRRELDRVGYLRFADVLAFRLYYRLFLARKDRAWLDAEVARVTARYGALPSTVPVLRTPSPNSAEAERFVRDAAPDLAIARCKTLLSERVFTIPRAGTMVMHPGICPEYRNSHGCFWALAHGDTSRVGMTLLRIDKGVDTGPVFGYYSYPYDERTESHIVIQHRVVFENLDTLGGMLHQVAAGAAQPIDTAGRASRSWGQPWLTRYLKWKRHAKRSGLNGAHDQPALP
jgi:folate-dependent phosphoribosylglycinamide formyltransferase PurN